MNLAESSVLHKSAIDTIEFLLNEFDRLFPFIISSKHINLAKYMLVKVNVFKEKSVAYVVHSMVHVSQTLRNFGPLWIFSTFNFKSAIGVS